MKTSNSVKEIASALAKAQGAIQGAVKDAKNPFFKSSYADLSSITEAIKRPFSDNGLSYTQQIVTNDKDECGVEMMLLHSSGEWIHYDPFFLPVSKDDAQGFGSCATYAARYQLRAISGVCTVDDDGNAAAAAKPNAFGGAKAITPTQEAHDAFERLPRETQDVIKEHAATLIHLHKDGGDMVGYIEQQDYDTEAKLALWSLLPSNVRSAIKHQQQVAALQKKAPLAAQA